MIVRCVKGTTSELSLAEAEFCARYGPPGKVGLQVGTDYLVFGMVFLDGRLWFLVCEDDDASYPQPRLHLEFFFDVVDGRIPPNWSAAGTGAWKGAWAFLPSVWSTDDEFFEHLVEGYQESVEMFHSIKEDLEQWHAG